MIAELASAVAEVSEGAEVAELSSGAEIDPDARIEPTDMTDGIGEMTSPEEVDPDARIRELPEAKGPQKTIEPNDFSQSENVVDKPVQNAEIDPDARINDNGNSEKVEEGYKSWDDVPHSTDPETGRERYELQSGKDTGALNSVPPPPNADIYVSDADGGNFTKVETDDKGRIVRISRPRIELSDKSQRTNETLQTVDKKDGRRDENGNKTDDGGHLVADEFGGSSEETNLVPMDSEVNRHGEWRKMERDIEKELNKEPPSEIKDFEVDLEYDDDTSRPSGFTVSYTVDDGKTQTEVTKYIRNERPEREDIRNAA